MALRYVYHRTLGHMILSYHINHIISYNIMSYYISVPKKLILQTEKQSVNELKLNRVPWDQYTSPGMAS